MIIIGSKKKKRLNTDRTSHRLIDYYFVCEHNKILYHYVNSLDELKSI